MHDSVLSIARYTACPCGFQVVRPQGSLQTSQQQHRGIGYGTVARLGVRRRSGISALVL